MSKLDSGYFKKDKQYKEKVMVAESHSYNAETVEDILALSNPFKAVPSRGISARVAAALGIRTRVDEFGDTLAYYFPYYKLTDGAPVLVGFKRKSAENVGAKSTYTSIGDIDVNCLLFGAVLRNSTTGKLQMAASKGKAKVVITEGEFDAAACMEALLENYKKDMPFPVTVSIGFGTVNAVQHISARINQEYLKQFETTVIAFDNDAATDAQRHKGVMKGQEALKAVADYLGESNIKVCALPPEYDPNDLLKQGRGRELFWAFTMPKDYSVAGFIEHSQIRHDAIRMPALGRPWPWPAMTKLTLGRRLGEGYYFSAGVKMGKCFGRDTKVRMYDGSVKSVQDILAGDLVMGDDSTPRKVLTTHSGNAELYKIKQKTGRDYIVNGSHTMVYKNYKTQQVETMSVDDMLSRYTQGKNGVHSFKGFHTAIEYPEKSLAVCPYTLGVWLGDGSRSDNRVTLNLEDSKVIIPFCGEMISLFNCSKSSCHEGTILTKLNVFKEFGGIKYIPEYILNNSKRVRKLVLAGIIDTDGSKNKGSACSYQIMTKYQELADSLYILCRSLGLKCSVTKVTKGIKSTGFTGEYYCVMLSGDLRDVPIQVTRKKPDAPIKTATNSSFNIESIGIGEYYGFQTDGNHLFCLEDYTVVHNSELLNEMVDHILKTEDTPPAVFKFEEEPAITCKKLAGKLAHKQFHNPEKVLFKTTDGDVDVWGELIPDNLKHTYFTEDELEKAVDNIGDRVIYYNNYGCASWEDVAEKIRYAVTVKGCKDVFIDPLTRLTAGMSAAEANTELERIADAISTMSKDLGFTYYIFCHLKAPTSGVPHEKGGKVESNQFTGSRAMMRACYYMLGLERNKSDELPEIVRNTSSLVLLEDRAFGRTGRVPLYFDKHTGDFRQPTEDEARQYHDAMAEIS